MELVTAQACASLLTCLIYLSTTRASALDPSTTTLRADKPHRVVAEDDVILVLRELCPKAKGISPSRGTNDRYKGGASDNLFAVGNGRIGIPKGLRETGSGGGGGDDGGEVGGDGRESTDISITAKWTKICDKLVTPDALAREKKKYEVTDGFVVVLRVLTKDKVQGYTFLTQNMRSQDQEEEEKRKELDDKRRKEALTGHLGAADDVLLHLTTVFEPAQAALITAEPTRSLPIEEIFDEDFSWKRKGITPSRGQNGCYHGGASDNLFAEGGGRIGVPSGLQKAGGARGDKGDRRKGAAGAGGNGDDGDGDDGDQQRGIIGRGRKAHPLARGRMDKIRLKIANYRAEYENLQLGMSLHATDMSSTSISSWKSSAAQRERNPVAGNRTSGGSAIATIAFNPRTREEIQERVKRQIRPVLISRKNLCRSLGSCPACRSKDIRAIKCPLSHHALEDILAEYPDAASDIEWALSVDNNPIYAEQNISSPNFVLIKQPLLGWRIVSSVFNGAIGKKLPPILRQKADIWRRCDGDKDVD